VFDGDWSTVQYMLFQLLENQQVPPEFFEATYMGIYPILTYAPNVMPRLPFLTVMQWHILSHWVHPNELDQCYKQCLEKEADINLSKSSPHYKAALQMYRDSCDPVKLATMITSYANWMSQFRPSALQHSIDFQPL
jgi:hypothetical protein